MKIFKLCVFLLLFGGNAIAQNKAKVDSLQQILKTNMGGKQKADVYNLLANAYHRSDSAKAMDYIIRAIALAKKHDYPAGLSDAWYLQGWICMIRGYYAEAMKHYQTSLQIALDADYQKGRAQVYGSIGSVWWYKGDYAKALKYDRHALKIRTKIGDKDGMARSYGNIGNIYWQQGNYSKSLEFYYKTLAFFEEAGNQEKMSTCLHNIGGVYLAQENYPRALEFYHRSLKIKEQLNSKNGIAYNSEYIGFVHASQGNYAKALKCYQRALDIREETGNKEGMSETLLHLGELALKQQQPQKAKQHFEKALALRKEIGGKKRMDEVWIDLGKVYHMLQKPDKAVYYLEKGMQLTNTPITIRTGAEYLALVYREQGKYKKALENYTLFKKMADSLYNKTTTKKLARLESHHVFEKEKDSLKHAQEQKEFWLNADIRQRKDTQQKLSLGLVLAAVLIIALWLFYRSKQRNNQKLERAYSGLDESNRKLKAAHEEIKTINELLSQKNEDVMASIAYARHIQEAVLPLDEKLKQHLPEHFVFFRPRDIVSGDFYWCREVNNLVFVAVADCTGHGVPGAFMTMLGAQALNNIIVQSHIHAPDRILQKLDEALIEILKSDNTSLRNGMDIALLVIDKQKQQLCYAGAKNPLIVVQNNEIQEIRGNLYSINGHRPENYEMTFTAHTVDLSTPAMLYLYSDGYQDQFGGNKGKKFTRARLHQLLLEGAGQPIEIQNQLLESTLAGWMQTGGWEQTDDILVMGIRL